MLPLAATPEYCRATMTAASTRLAIVAHPQIYIHSTNAALSPPPSHPALAFLSIFYLQIDYFWGTSRDSSLRSFACERPRDWGSGASGSSLVPTALWPRNPPAGRHRRGTRRGAGCLPAPEYRRCRP